MSCGPMHVRVFERVQLLNDENLNGVGKSDWFRHKSIMIVLHQSYT